ncbi:MAG: alpha-L-rhamnosidase N-terminal domain-containing protein [Planctomycetota bacterium]
MKLLHTLLALSSLLIGSAAGQTHSVGPAHPATQPPRATFFAPLDLAPARWIWYPAERTLPNTVILFRRSLTLDAAPKSARGWILGESRYRLEVNGARVQWGPAPNDPRWPECDPMDLTAILRAGENVVGAAVLFYGHGDGTWPMGLPGFLFRLEIEHANGRKETIVSDNRWQCHLCRAWEPGQHRRSYLRSFQEVFDARTYPYGWSTPGFTAGREWISAEAIKGRADQPVICAERRELLWNLTVQPEDRAAMHLRPRSIAMMREEWIPAEKLTEQHRIEWLRPIDEYFAMRPRQAWKAEPTQVAVSCGEGAWEVQLDRRRGTTLTFEFPEQRVGFPGFTIVAPERMAIEMLVHDAHEPGSPQVLLNTGFHAWTRFICREGINVFETFDFETLRWLQLHLPPGEGAVTIFRVGMRRREHPWPVEPRVTTSEVPLQKLFDAAVTTLRNCAQETLVDTMGRERQQYSGDVSHQQHALLLLCGETRQVARFLVTYSQGLTKDGYFLDCWPAVDRLNRLAQRQLDMTQWGPLLDHGVQFVFNGWDYHQYTGDIEPLREVFPRYLRFAEYLESRIGKDGLLPVDDTGVPWVWINFGGFSKQRHKQCCFNLLVAEMFGRRLPDLCRLFGENEKAEHFHALGRLILSATQRRFWSAKYGCFVDNLPWLAEEGRPVFHDMTLGESILFDQCPGSDTAHSVELLVRQPAGMGKGYPPNACWRLWALAKAGRADAILREFREVWAPLPSVRLNNTISEFFIARPDAQSQWSHAAVAPLYIAAMSLAGIQPLEPGFARYEIRPQLADLPDLKLDVTTPHGLISFDARGPLGAREMTLTLPPRGQGELVVDPRERLPLDPSGKPGRFRLPQGQTIRLTLQYL